jgi:hypothetical protein
MNREEKIKLAWRYNTTLDSKQIKKQLEEEV